jgi:predicted SnoaL-like aldol condensation-catalyzing enzyme
MYATNRRLARFRPPPLEIESIPSDVQLIRPIPPDRRGRELIVDEIIQTEISANRATEPFIEYFIQLYQYEEGLYIAGLTTNVPNPYLIVEQARKRWWRQKRSNVRLIRKVPSDRRGRDLLVDELIQTEINEGRATEPFIEYFIELYQKEERRYADGLISDVPNPYHLAEQARRLWWRN